MKTLQRTSVFHACLILLVVSVWLPSVHAAEEIALVKEGGVYKIPRQNQWRVDPPFHS